MIQFQFGMAFFLRRREIPAKAENKVKHNAKQGTKYEFTNCYTFSDPITRRKQVVSIFGEQLLALCGSPRNKEWGPKERSAV
jgi:hypothetical protein